MSREEPPEECRAAAIVASVTGCAAERLDVGGGIQRPDYALRDDSGHDIGVLEVTAITSAAHLSFFSAKARKHRTWSDASLRSNWIVTVDAASRQLRGLREPVTNALIKLEAAGASWAVSQPEMYRYWVDVLPDHLLRLGTVEVRALGSRREDGGFVTLNVMPMGGAYGIESAIAALDSVLQLPDDRRKLAGGLERRELFVWVDPPSAAASALSTFSSEPWCVQVAASRPPALPAEVTAVWAGLWSEATSWRARALWRGTTSGWDILDPPES